MFDLMPNVWLPLIAKSSVSDRPMRIKIAGEDLVVHKTTSNDTAVLIDRCPHRGVPLSLGKVLDNGNLQCLYHGWEFDSQGTCVNAPYCELDNKRMNNITIHSREAAGTVWVFTGEEIIEFDPPGLLASTELPFRVQAVEWKTHWTRVMENSLDYAHVAFVHRGSFGAFIPQKGEKLAVSIKQTERGFISIPSGAHYDGNFCIEWVTPNCSIQPFDFMGWRGYELAVPIDENHTRVFFIRAILTERGNKEFDFPVDPVEEDRIICESIPSEVPKFSDAVNVPYDAAALTFRHWYQQNMRKS